MNALILAITLLLYEPVLETPKVVGDLVVISAKNTCPLTKIILDSSADGIHWRSIKSATSSIDGKVVFVVRKKYPVEMFRIH
jgi:hypothetical protein